MPSSINKAIELLEQDQPISCVSSHSGAELSYEVGKRTAKPESTEGRPWGQPLKKLEGAPLNLG